MGLLQQALIGYGAWLMAGRLGQAAPAGGTLDALTGGAEFGKEAPIGWARRLLGDEAPEGSPETKLASIFSYVKVDEPGRAPVEAKMPRRALSLDLAQSDDEQPEALWRGFWGDVTRLKPGGGLFETFTALMARYGWNVPGSLPDEGVSVYEQFKAVAALSHVVSEDGGEALLVSGDLPGIQEMLYTITAKGAAKGLRGRSFYLQLLNDAIVRAVLRELGLPFACVVFNAGGNFLLVARAGDEARLGALRDEINRRLLALHGGELFLALGCGTFPARQAGAGSFGKAVEGAKERADEEKGRAFARLAPRVDALFGPMGFGGLGYCDVCHVDLPGDRPSRCDQCRSFEELAGELAATQDQPQMAVVDKGQMPALDGQGGWRGRPAWRTVLSTFGYEYHFAGKAQAGAGVFLYRLNDTACLPSQVEGDCAYGFRFLAHTTPRIRQGEDLEALRRCVDSDEEGPRRGDIRSTTIMARCDSTGIDRYGALRMDVDDLGRLFAERLEAPSLMRTSALSAALGLFFEGWLNRLCRSAAEEWQAQVGRLSVEPGAGAGADGHKLPYVIYAGGDDLFIVGPWDVLPAVAWRIRRDFSSFVREGAVRPDEAVEDAPLTISAGIFAESAKFPLYQAADQAREALGTAKRRKEWQRVEGEERLVTVKNAINFLDTTVSWEEFRQSERLALKLATMIKRGVEQDGRADRAPHALVQLLGVVAREYGRARGEAKPGGVAYGRWMPLLAYGLRRMVDRAPRRNQNLRKEIMGLSGEALDLTRAGGAAQWRTIQFLGLPVRWAEFLIRSSASTERKGG